MSPCRVSIPPHRNQSKTNPNCVPAENQLHLIGNILRHFQICHGQESIASHRSYSKTFPNFVLVEVHLHLIEIIIRQF